MCCNGILILLALVIGFFAIVYLLYQTYSYIRCGCGKYGPFVSSYGKIKQDILAEARLILQKSSKSLKVTDLGCGSGALLLPLAREFPQHEFIGYEWDIVPLTMGKIKAAGLPNIKFIKGDYMKQNYATMDLILCYVLKVTGEPLGKKLAQEIKPNCTVISEMFPLEHLEEVKQIASSIYGVPEKIFIYKKPRLGKKLPSATKKKVSAKTVAETKASHTAKTVQKVKQTPKKTVFKPKKQQAKRSKKI